MRKVNLYTLLLLSCLLLGGCNNKVEKIILEDNKGIFLTDTQSTTLPIRKMNTIESTLINQPYQKNDQLASQFIELYQAAFQEEENINYFTLDNVHLLVHRKYPESVKFEIASGTDTGFMMWDSDFSEEELVYDLQHYPESKVGISNEVGKPFGVYISIYHLDAEEMIIDNESYFFLIKELEEE